MPAFIKTPEDERLWQKAQDVAAESGHKEDWAYITGIYKKMKGGKVAETNPVEELALRALLAEDEAEQQGKQGAAYSGNLGIMEMVQFYKMATSAEQTLMDKLLASNRLKAAWALLKKVTGVKLHDPEKWARRIERLADRRMDLVESGFLPAPRAAAGLKHWCGRPNVPSRNLPPGVQPTPNGQVSTVVVASTAAEVVRMMDPYSRVTPSTLKNYWYASCANPLHLALVSQGKGIWFATDPTARKYLPAEPPQAEGGGSKVAKSNAEVVEVPNTFSPVIVQEPKATRKEHPFEGYIDFQGIQIDVENKKGSTRSGTGPEGDWSTHMFAHYGEIRGTEGTDGDKLDVYVGDNHDASLVVVIHQHNPWDGEYDEDKVVLGCESVEEAIGLYKKQYDRPGFYKPGEHTAMPIGAFWRWVHDERNRGKRVSASGRKRVFRRMGTENKATTWLQGQKLRARSRGSLEDALLQAGFYAKKQNTSLFVYMGNSYMSAVWRVTYKESEYLSPINNTGLVLYEVTPDLEVLWYRSADTDRTAATPVLKITMGEASKRLKADHWRQDRMNPGWDLRIADFYAVRIRQERNVGTKAEHFVASWYTGNPSQRWSWQQVDTLKAAVDLVNKHKAEADRITAEELGESAEGKLARLVEGSMLLLRLSREDVRGLDSMLGFDYADDGGVTKQEEQIVRKAVRQTDASGLLRVSAAEAQVLAQWKALGRQEYASGDDFEADPRAVKRYLAEWTRSARQSRQASLRWTPLARLDGSVLKDASWVKWVRLTSTGQMGETVARRMPNGWQVQLLRSGQDFDPKAPIKGRPKKDADVVKLYQEQGGTALHIVKESVALSQAPTSPVLTPQEQRERDIVSQRTKGQNPFVYNPFGRPENGWQIGFYILRRAEPLWWTGSGFKDLSRVRSEPQMFKTRNEAEDLIFTKLIKFIADYREGERHMVVGWDTRHPTPVKPPVVKSPTPMSPKPSTAPKFTLGDVTSFLRRMITKKGGRHLSVDYYDGMWDVDPANRQRIDHYVGQFYDPGPDDDPEGWDEEGWRDEYADPLQKEVQQKLDDQFGKDMFSVDIGEKGHIFVYPTGAKKVMKLGQVVPKQPWERAIPIQAARVLSYLRAMFWNYLTSHWQAAGDPFYGDHLLFQRMYEQIDKEIDGLAEKVVGLCGPQAVDAVSQAREMAEHLQTMYETGCPFHRGRQSEWGLQALLKQTLEEIEADGVLSLGLDDMLRTIANDHETHLYLLQQRMKTTKTATALGTHPDADRMLSARHLLRKVAALAGTDTATFYVVAPEQLFRIIQDGGWADYAHHLWELRDGDIAMLLHDMDGIIQKHQGAVLHTSRDGAFDFQVVDPATGKVVTR